MKKPFPVPVRVHYSCAKCPAFCCTYTDIEVTARDLERLARHFGLSLSQAREKYTKMESTGKVRVMRHRSDKHFITACMMLDQETRRCTIYEARPGVCRKYPDSTRCGYYEFLKFERNQQGDDEHVATTT
ncbi:MAG TPA: YkgJ family cysteine cluster protein [Usitatibacter sp.]|nr:YkgJ family cysteine cluster protein [Usitatibacter sp.]